MKKILMAAVALLILGGAGAGGYFYFQKPASASVGETDAHKSAGEAGSGKKEEKAGGHGGKGGNNFVEMDPLILPVIDSNGVTQTVSIVVVIEVEEASVANEIKLMTPRLKDAYIQDMYGMLNKNGALKDGVIQVGMIKERLSAISKRVMGEGKVHDVLLQVIQQRPL